MKINLAKSAGFCFGVKRALKIAHETKKPHLNVEMLGDIVHNEDVVKQISKIGIKKVTKLKKGTNKLLLVRAHGVGKQTINSANKLGYNIVDATCPMVKEIHNIAVTMEKKGYKIIVIGDKKHDEVLGILGQLDKKAILIDTKHKLPLKTLKKVKKAAVVVQSTQNYNKVMRVSNNLKKVIKHLMFFNTICNPTRLKQKEIKKLPLENDVMIIIGSKHSANTKRLYQISRELNKNSYWVNKPTDIKKEWLKNVKSVGVTAGASTPDVTTNAVIKYIRKLSKLY